MSTAFGDAATSATAYEETLIKSMLWSCDQAHSVHPNYGAKYVCSSIFRRLGFMTGNPGVTSPHFCQIIQLSNHGSESPGLWHGMNGTGVVPPTRNEQGACHQGMFVVVSSLKICPGLGWMQRSMHGRPCLLGLRLQQIPHILPA